MTNIARRLAPEKRIQRDVKRALYMLGFFVSDLTMPRATMMTPGIPDLRASHTRWRKCLWVEVKSQRGRLTAEQAVWHREARDAGDTVVTVRSVEELLAELRRIGCPIPE